MFNSKIWYYVAGACAILAGACTIATTVRIDKTEDQPCFQPNKDSLPQNRPEPFDPMEADRQDENTEKYSQN